MPFLTARWSNLCLWTYPVPPAVLQPHVPPGLELDMRDGTAFASLVAFDFLDTRVLGVSWPGYRNFPEINLRFYVRRPADSADGEPQRGVCFIRELVPKPLVAAIARRLYNEPYAAAHIYSGIARPKPGDDGAPESLTVEHQFLYAGRLHSMGMTGQGPASCPPTNSDEHFFKEHRWGFGRSRSGRLLRYEVIHPVWNCYKVSSHFVDLDWTSVYGPEWAFLKNTAPVSTILAQGSEVSVSRKSSP